MIFGRSSAKGENNQPLYRQPFRTSFTEGVIKTEVDIEARYGILSSKGKICFLLIEKRRKLLYISPRVGSKSTPDSIETSCHSLRACFPLCRMGFLSGRKSCLIGLEACFSGTKITLPPSCAADATSPAGEKRFTGCPISCAGGNPPGLLVMRAFHLISIIRIQFTFVLPCGGLMTG